MAITVISADGKAKVLTAKDIEDIVFDNPTPEEYKRIMEMDYSKEAMDKELVKQFKHTGLEIQALDDKEEFNIWDAYSHLKNFVGINDVWFEEDEFQKRMKNIQEVLDLG